LEDGAEAAAPMGNLYNSDESLQLFSLSMRHGLTFVHFSEVFVPLEGRVPSTGLRYITKMIVQHRVILTG
jgi:hypothetical protein